MSFSDSDIPEYVGQEPELECDYPQQQGEDAGDIDVSYYYPTEGAEGSE